MRVSRTAAALLGGIGLAVSGVEHTQAAPCDTGPLLQIYLQSRCANDSSFLPPDRALTFDHRRRRWEGEYTVTWARPNPGVCTVTVARIDSPHARRDGTAWTYRTGRDRVMAFVTHTNPMLYSAKANEAEPRDIEELASLRKVAALLGGGITAAFAGLAAVNTGAQTISIKDTGAGFSDATLTAQSAEVETRPSPPPPHWEELSKQLALHSQKRVAAVAAIFTAVQAPFEALDTDLSELATHEQAVVPYLQGLEDGHLATTLARAFVKIDLASLDASFAGARAAFVEFKKSQPIACGKPYGLMRDAVEVLLGKDLPAGGWTKVQTAAQELSRLTDADCKLPDGGLNPDEIAAFKAIGNALPLLPPAGPFTPADRAGLDRLFTLGEGYLGMIKAADEFHKDADELLSKRGDSISLAAALVELRAREEARVVVATAGACHGDGILEVPTRHDVFAWDTVHPHAFELAADAPIADAVTSHRIDPGPVAYELEPRTWFRPTVSFGLATSSKLREPTFELVEIEGVAGKKMYVEKVKEEKRLTVPTAFISFGLFPGGIPHRRVELAVDLGVGVDPTKPAFFLGGSVKLIGGIRFAVGRTWQKITALDGQTALTVRPDGTFAPESLEGHDVRAVRTKTTFPHALYLSLSFPISSLPFFGGGE